jgi:hypothetical protein
MSDNVLSLEAIDSLVKQARQSQVYELEWNGEGNPVRIKPANLQPGRQSLSENLIPYPRDRHGHLTANPDLAVLQESSGAGSIANFPDLLRQGVMFDVFSGYNEAPVVWPQLVNEVGSNKPQEEYLRDAGIGLLPIVTEGKPYPEAALNLDDGVIIKNNKYGMIVPVTEEMRRFDQLGKVRDIANLLGRAARLTEEQAVMNVLTTTGNYTRTVAAGDNTTGSNTVGTAFNAANFIIAWNTLTTMMDRKTQQIIGVQPDTLICAPSVWFVAKMLLQSPSLVRAGGNTTAEVYGTGEMNPLSIVKRIVVSPYYGAASAYAWGLLESNRALKFQRVDPVQVLPPEYGYTDDTWKYRVRTWFGVGMKDDRFAFYNTGSAPTVV